MGAPHDLIKLTQLLRSKGIVIPVSDSQLRKLNPFAVTFRYDEADIETLPREEAASLVSSTQSWAEMMVKAVRKREEQDAINHD